MVTVPPFQVEAINSKRKEYEAKDISEQSKWQLVGEVSALPEPLAQEGLSRLKSDKLIM